MAKKNGKHRHDHGDEINQLSSSLSDAAKKLMDASIGVEHIFREVGQMYAIARSHGFDALGDSILSETLNDFPEVVAQLMLDGFPLELMNGDSSSIQLTWVKAVFSSLSKLLKEKKIFVMSVLGVQSSGKSTLLNAMFGLQFAVSAGRCTRGVFAQLIAVESSTGYFPFDYIKVVDTDGLRATEMENGAFKHDNEIATFVLGLGDVTVMNIMGENYSEIQDVLQIAVHAFLRMKLVSRGQKCEKSCIFVHQNVSAPDAAEKNKLGSHQLQNALDKAAMEAAKEESNNEITSFSQILDSDWKENVHFVSGLWLGDPPMAPPNSRYSDRILSIKMSIFSIFSNETVNFKDKRFPLIQDIMTRLDDLWKGIQSDGSTSSSTFVTHLS